MSKYVVYTETTAQDSKQALREWVGQKVYDIFPDQPVYIKSALFEKRLVTEEDKQYTLQNGDFVYTSIRPLGGGGFLGGVGDLFTASVLTPINPTYAFKRYNEGIRKVTRPLTNLFTPDINDPNFERDERRTRPQLSGSQNTALTEIVPFIFGETRMTPYYGQNNYSLVQDGGSLQKLNQYFIAGMNNFTFEDEKLGETSLTDYSVDTIERRFSFGGTANLSNPSVISSQKAEQLSYDKDTVVSQSSSSIYNETVSNGSLTYEPTFEFRNTVPTDFSDKTFTLEVDYYMNGDTNNILTFTHDFVVTDADLVLVSGKTYTATDTYTETLAGGDTFTTILETRLFPASTTRVTSSEIAQELECELDIEEITCGAFNDIRALNNPINSYTGVVSAVVDTSKDNLKEIDINFSFPQGLYKQNNDGSRSSRSTKVDIQIKEEGGEYQDLDQFTLFIRDMDGNKLDISTSTTTVSGSEVTFTSPSDIKTADELFYRMIGLVVPTMGKYTVRIRSADFSDKTNFDIGYPQVEFINYWYNENAVNSSIFPNVVQVNLKASASTQLTGTLQQYNFLAKARLNIWNGTDWDTIAETGNPAAVIRYVLLNNMVNIRAEDESIVDNDSLVELYEYCEDNNIMVAGVIAQQYKIESFLDAMVESCRSTWTFYNGKYYFATDKEKPARQMFTQHNTYNFTSNPNIGKTTTALRMTYLDKTDWVDKEFTIYWYDGTFHDAPKINTTDEDYDILKQQIDFVVDLDVAKSIAGYRLELLQAKRRNFTFGVNIESLDLKILDRIYVSDTTNMVDSSSGLIKELITSGGNITGFKLYSRIDIPTASTITIRSLNTSTEEIEINSYEVANSGNSDIIELVTPIVNNGVIQGKTTRMGLSKYQDWQYDGDMFEIGQGNIIKCTVDSIKFNDNFTAVITAREA